MSYCKRCKKQKANNDYSSFHKFPNDDATHNRWLQSINQPNWMPSPSDRLCSDHFVEECFEFKPNLKGARTRLKKDSIPTIFGGRTVNYNIGSENCISNPRQKNGIIG